MARELLRSSVRYERLGARFLRRSQLRHLQRVLLEQTQDPDDLMKGAFRISECLFQRVSTEFLSLSWFVHERSRIFDPDLRPPIELANLVPGEIITSPPTGWTNVRDFYK